MKIGIDASRLNFKQYTGTEWYSYYIIKNILDIDRENQYFLFSKEKLSDEFLDYKNVKNIVLDWKYKYFWTLFKLSISLRKYNLDLFFSPAHYLPICKCKKVVTWHDLGYEYYKEYYSRKQLLSLVFGAKLLKKTDAIITPSYYTKKDIINKYKIDGNKIFVTHLGIDFNKYQKEYSENEINNILQKYNLSNNYILFISRLENKKNLEILLDAFEYFKDNFKENIQLVLIGKEGYGYENINQKIEISKHKEDIKIIGWIEEYEKIAIIKNAKLSCNFSHFEGFGLGLIEAMFCKIPMLISNLEVFKELGIYDYCFCKNDYKEIAIKMDTIFLRNEIRSEMINNNYFESQKFNWKKTAEKTIEVFNNLK